MQIGSYRTQLQGEAGNHRVASELLLRGHNVSFHAVDMGVDLVADDIVRIQVKSAHMVAVPRYASSQPSYAFFLIRGPRAVGQGKSLKSEPRIFSKKVDFVILWGIEENRFWIVPAQLLDGRHSITVGLGARWIRTEDQTIKNMYDAGHTQREIAQYLKLTINTVSRRLRGLFTRPPDFMADMCKVRDCEGKWEQIQEYIDTMREA